MNIAFGIITGGANDALLEASIASIRALEIPKAEIVLVGKTQVPKDGLTWLDFEEAEGENRICAKKNLIAPATKANVIVYLHDYIAFDPDWYAGWEAFGWDWDIAMNRVLNLDGSRHYDWVVTAYRHAPSLPPVFNCSQLRYEDRSKIDQQYVPGNFWLAKRQVMLEHPLEQALRWAELEDVEWSERVLPVCKYVMNPRSTVRYLKQK